MTRKEKPRWSAPGEETKFSQRGGNFYSFGASDLVGVPQVTAITNNGASSTGAIPASDISQAGGRRRRGMSMKTMKRMLKKNGLKVSGRKSTLTKRMKKARLMKGGASMIPQRAGVLEFTGAGAERGMGGFTAGTRGISNDVMPLSG